MNEPTIAEVLEENRILKDQTIARERLYEIAVRLHADQAKVISDLRAEILALRACFAEASQNAGPAFVAHEVLFCQKLGPRAAAHCCMKEAGHDGECDPCPF